MISALSKFSQTIIIEIVVFLCGAIGMIVELVGSRVLSPYFGSSLYVWTSLIGVILGALSLGYYLGGILSDRYPSRKNLARLILISGVFISFTAFSKEWLLHGITTLFKNDLRLPSLISTIILFAPSGITLGMVSPYAAKLKLTDLSHSGQAVGHLYAISTFGSITGTFTAGFFLIPSLGNTLLLFMLAFVLIIISSFVYYFRQIVPLALFSVFLLFFLSREFNLLRSHGVILDLDTQYSRILMRHTTYAGRFAIAMADSPFGSQSIIYPDNPDYLIAPYLRFFRHASQINPNISRALMIGGGGYTFPRDFLTSFPSASIDVVEIDPVATRLAYRYFNLQDDPRLVSISQDARTYVRNTSQIYDVIYVDAFNGSSLPYQLTTREFLEDMRSHLAPNGVIMVNIVSPVTGPHNGLLLSLHHTYATVFPKVDIVAQSNLSPEIIQSVILVANQSTESPLSSLTAPFDQLLPSSNFTGPSFLLTDDYAPVDYLVSNIYF